MPIYRKITKIGEVWRRLVGRRVFHRGCEKYGPELVAYGQYAIGVSGGGEHVHHGLNIVRELHPGKGNLGTDAACAFNFLCRRAMWEDTLALGDGEIIAYYILNYSTAPIQVVHGYEPGGGRVTTRIPSITGVQMGCSGGSFYFSRTWTLRVLKVVVERFSGAQPFAICDDLHVVCDIGELGAISVLAIELAATVGIELNADKSFYIQFPPEHPTALNTLRDSRECRERLALLATIPVREWDGPEGGFMCNGAPIGSPRYVEDQLDLLVASISKAVSMLLGLVGCSIQTRMVLLIYCVHSKMLHLLRAVPPSAGLEATRRIDETLRVAIATITFTAPELLEESHNNKALAQLCLPPSFGGAGLAALERTHPAAFLGSVASCLKLLSKVGLLADALGGPTADWEGGAGPLGNVFEVWHRGVGNGPAFSSLPKIRALKQLHDSNDSLSLDRLARAPKKAQRAFARALADFDFAAIVNNVNIDPTVKARIIVCKGYGASAWLRALPCNETRLLDAQYGVAWALFFGLPVKAIGPHTTCVGTCAYAARLDAPARQQPGWAFGFHFFNCAAGSKTEGVTNMLGRHDALSRVFGNFYTSLGFTVCTNKQAQSYSLVDGRKVDMSVEDLSRRAAPTAIDFTVLLPWAPLHQDEVLRAGGNYLRKFGDEAKTKKHAPAVEAAGAKFLPAAFSVLGAWAPAITKEFSLLWKAEIDSAKAAGEAVWPVIQRKMLWRAKISVALMRANAQMLLSRARCQGTLNPAHAHRARCSHLASHRSPAQRPKDYSLPHSRRLCADKRDARALCVTPNARRRA